MTDDYKKVIEADSEASQFFTLFGILPTELNDIYTALAVELTAGALSPEDYVEPLDEEVLEYLECLAIMLHEIQSLIAVYDTLIRGYPEGIHPLLARKMKAREIHNTMDHLILLILENIGVRSIETPIGEISTALSEERKK